MSEAAGDSVNDELVSQFMAFTGSADPERAKSYLEMSAGSLETAVGLFMEHEQGGGDTRGGGAATSAGGGGSGFEDQIRAPDATRSMRLMDDNMMGVPDPAYQMMNAMMDEQFANAFAVPSGPVDARAAVDAAIAASGESKADDDDSDEDGKTMDEDDDEEVQVLSSSGPPGPARLSDMFAAPTHLIHKAGGFQGARTMAKDTKRWLLVNIQRDSEFASHALNRDVWRDELVENLIREGFIFWQQMDVTPEGRTYTERYQVMDYPHIGIIDPRTGRLMWRKEGWTQENPLRAETFAEMAMDFCSRNSFDRPPQAPRPGGGSARPTKRPMHEMSEDEQLQAAMRASMTDVQTGDDEVEIMDDDAKPPAEEKKPSLNDELVAMELGDEPATGPRIQFRMHDGKRIVRRFDSSCTVKNVYAFVAQSNEEARGGKEFVLMAGFPPNDLINDIDNTIEECKLSGQAVTVRWKN